MEIPAESPVLLFDEDGRMYIIDDAGMADKEIESTDEYIDGFDGRGRRVHAVGQPGDVRLVCSSEDVDEEEVRNRVERYYAVFATRHPTRMPPEEAELAAFIEAVAEDEIDE